MKDRQQYRSHIVMLPVVPEGLTPTDASKRHPDDERAARQLVSDLKHVRLRKKLSQREAATRMIDHPPQSMISGIENGGDRQFSTYQKYARALGSRLEVTIDTGDPVLDRWLNAQAYTNRTLSYAGVTSCPITPDNAWHTPESIAAAQARPRIPMAIICN